MRVTESERAMLHELHAIKKDPHGKRLIHFFVSLAPPLPPADMARKVKTAKALIKNGFSRTHYCEVFSARNGDIFVTYSHVSISEVLAICNQLEQMFCGDNGSSVRNSYNEYAFYKVADALSDLDKIFSTFKAIITEVGSTGTQVSKRLMTPEDLSQLSEKLRFSDVRHCIFNQPIYFIGKKVPSIEFLEFYVSIQQVETHLLPGVSLSGNPWLFHALCEDLDRATLRAVGREIADYRHKAFSVNVGLNTVLSKEFADFYGLLPSKLAGKIVLEVNKTDLVQNLPKMKDARSLADEKGLKICIDGMSWYDFEIMNLNRLSPHFIKVGWNNDLLAAGQAEITPLVEARKHLPEGCELILTRCDDPRAFVFARTLGVRYVQGRLADQYFKTGMEL